MRWLQFRRRGPTRSIFSMLFWVLCSSIVWVQFKLCYRLHIEGKDRVPRSGPLLYISNHQSHYDPIIVGLAVNDRPPRSIARSSLYKVKLLAWLIRGLGGLPIERGKGDRKSIQAAIDELKAGGCVMIFPEGARTFDGASVEYQKGMLLLMKRSEAPIIPVGFDGAFDIWPRTRTFPRLFGRCAVKVGEQIDPAHLSDMSPSEALDMLRARVDELRMDMRQWLRDNSNGRWPKPGPGDEQFLPEAASAPTT